jgi:hypothetical protein
MPPTTFTCKSKSPKCQTFASADLGQVIEHFRREHHPHSVKRPNALGVADSHGHLWYCFWCVGAYGKDHKSFGSDQAMWNHLNQCHDHWLAANIIPEDEKPDDDDWTLG